MTNYFKLQIPLVKKIILILVLIIQFTKLSAQTNTIIVITDDVSPDYFGFYNESIDTANTPNLRSLLNKGVLFTQVWANPLCSPTRAGLLTGKYSLRTGIGSVVGGISTAQIDTNEMSIPKLLKYKSPTNYNTGCIGKWHLTSSVPNRYQYPNKLGFDLYSGNFLGEIPDYYYYQRIKNGIVDTVSTYATTQTVDDAINWLGSYSNTKPFFMWLAFNAPHIPFHLPPSNLHTVQGLTGTTAHINANPKEYFKAAIEAMDTELGRLLNYLDNANMLDSTNIVFIGDNGNDSRVSQSIITNHSKGTIYNYGVRVPLLIAGPSIVNPNRISDALINSVDLFGTVLELSNFPNWIDSIPVSNLPIDSKSIMPILNNTATTTRDWTYSELFNNPTNVKDGKSIRNQDFHLLHFDNGVQEFYNLSSDQFELNNLLDSSMTNNEVLNYYQLCDTLNSLTGTTNCLTLALEDKHEAHEIQVLPNPATNNIYINTSQNTVRHEIYTAEGIKVITNNSKNIDISNLSSGLYLVLIYLENNKTSTHKLIVNN